MDGKQLNDSIIERNEPKQFIEEEKKENDRAEERHEMEDNEIGTVIRQPARFAGKTWGIVIYGEPNTYPVTNDERRLFHISIDFSTIITKLAETLKEHHKIEFQQITGGHEHGKKDDKCHLQICIQLATAINTIIKPGKFELEGITYLYLAQKAKNPYALLNYCKKDGEFYYLYPDKVIKKVFIKNKDGIPTDKINPYATIVNNKGLIDAEQAKDILVSHASRDFFMSNSNINKAIEQLTKPQLPPPIWTFPDYLKEFKDAVLYTWFIKWCFPEELSRRKALCLYSKERAMGKTTFAKNLINHEDYIVIFRNSFNKESTLNKIPKLLILDDMQPYTDQNKETWKGLIAGEKTAIRDAYLNFLWDYNVPCIITTNNASLVTNLMLDDQFSTQIVIVEIDSYMGPSNTKVELFTQKEFHVSETIWKAMNEKKKQREEFIKEKRNPFQVQSVQQIQPIQNKENEQLKEDLITKEKHIEYLLNSRNAFKEQFENAEWKLKEKSSLEKEFEEMKRERDNLKLQLCTAKAQLGIKRKRDEEEEPAGIDLGDEDSEIEEIIEEPNDEDLNFINDEEEISIQSKKKERKKKLKKAKEIIE